MLIYFDYKPNGRDEKSFQEGNKNGHPTVRTAFGWNFLGLVENDLFCERVYEIPPPPPQQSFLSFVRSFRRFQPAELSFPPKVFDLNTQKGRANAHLYAIYL